MTLFVAAGVAACARDDRNANVGTNAAPAATSRALAAQTPLPSGKQSPFAGETANPATESPGAAPSAQAPGPAATGPQIYALSATPSVVHAGEAVAFVARTTDDIVTVTASVASYTLPFTRNSPGRFALAFTIPPNVPGIFHGTYALNVVARSQQGTSVSRSISIDFQ
ncbi:MAG: hypothetical protein IAI49_10135 [Candidatus Eremiobacteraeota bacterium]|nr:hypothetical protein [Candidatus Eremiobacteraeota bacterium]